VTEVRFRKSAQADVQKAYEYFEARSAGLGVEFLERVEEATTRIATNPEQYQTVSATFVAPISRNSATGSGIASSRMARS
jgi:hypothetical protein